MKVELAQNREPWDDYVSSTGPDRLYHFWSWREVIEETFGHRPYYLAAIDGNEIRGVLPLVSMRSRLFGNFLVSMPFFSYGGVLTDSTEAREKLLAHAAELGRELGASHIELRQGDECAMSWMVASPKVTMEIDLPATVDDYLNRLSTSRNKKIRYNLKHGLRAEWGGAEAIPIFYRIFTINMRNLGTPVYPREFFENQFRRFPDRLRIVTMWDGAKAVAAGFLIAHRETLELPWAASLEESRKREAPMIMYWTLIESAIQDGFRKLDLGRCTRGSGNWAFKRHWSPTERPLHWYYWLRSGASIPELRPDNPRFKLATEVWKWLPLAVANGLGPRLVRSIP
jgi:FemAB-related protein (PEP-CTERM system-associated)